MLTPKSELETKMDSVRASLELHAILHPFLIDVLEKAEAQLQHSLTTNVPKGILKREDIVENAFRHGLVSAFSKLNQWGIEPSVQLAAELLEDVNAHSLARPLFDELKKI
jgi:hypothetical protein